MTATALLIPVSVVVVAAPGWFLAWSRRRPQVKPFDCAAEEAVRLVRPASSQWMGWE